MDPSTTKEVKIYSDIYGHFLTTSIRRNQYIYVMYVYYCNVILNTAIKNRNDKEMIRDFTSLTEDLKSRVIHPGFCFKDNKASTDLKLTMMTINIKYHLVRPSNRRTNNSDIAIQTFKNHLIAVLCSIDKYFYIILW